MVYVDDASSDETPRRLVEQARRFPRLRVGIGPPRGDAADFVLAPFAASEAEDVAISIADAAEATLHWLVTGDLEACMTRYQTRWNQGP